MLALAIWLWVSRRIFAIAVILLSTIVAWFAAEITAEYTLALIQKMLDEIAAPGKNFPIPTINFTLAVCGVLGGLAGSATLTFALSLVCKEFGAFENWARIVMPGTALRCHRVLQSFCGLAVANPYLSSISPACAVSAGTRVFMIRRARVECPC